MQFWHAAISRVFNISIFSGLTTTPGAASTALPLGSVVKPPSSLASSTASPLPTTPDSAVSQSSNSVQQLPPALANGLLMNRGIVQPDVQQVRNLVLIIMFPKLRSLEQWKSQNNFWQQNVFLSCSCRFLLSNKLEQLEFKLQKIIGIKKYKKLKKNGF